MALRHEEVKKIYRFDEFQVDARKQMLLRAGNPITLNAKAFNLLLVLVTSGGRELSKDELMHLVWQDQIVEENNLAVHIYNLRKILGERKDEHRYILTIPGVGYRFVADVIETTTEPDELFMESRTVTRIVVEEDRINPIAREGVSAGVNLTPFNQGEIVNRNVVSLPNEIEAAKSTANATRFQSRHRKLVWLAALLTGIFLAAGLSGYWLYRSRLREAPEPAHGFHRQIALTRLTNSGQIDRAVISPDGKYVAYISGESDGNSLWLRQTGTASDIRLLPPTKAEFWGLTFSPDGRFIYYNLFTGDHIDFELFRVPSLGGIVEKIPNVSSRAIAFSPDGKRIAYIQSESDSGFNALMVAEADGNHQQILARKEYPNTFNTEGQGVAWSPDGNTIAGLVNQFEADASYFTIVGINAKDGTEKPLSERRWYEVSGIEWLKNGSGLLLSAKENLLEPVQIWLLPYPQGEARQVTKDVNHYGSLSLTADGESLAAVQRNIVNGIFVGDIGGDDFKEIASEVGALDPLAWTPDGKIVFRSSRDGVANLWVMDADGTGRRQLTVNAHVDSRGLSVSPDGRYIVFVSWRSGKLNLWRVDAGGGNLTQLTDGEGDVYPRCAPDGASVIFQRGIYSKPTLWKVSLEGGRAEPLTEFRAKWAALSNDGSRLSYFQMAEGKWRIGIMSSAGGAPLQRLDAPANLKQSTVTWSPDNQALFYIGVTGNVGNVWSLPFDGAAARPLTAFTSHWLADFSLSADGRQLAVTRSRSVSDVVLLKNAASP